MNSIQFRQPEPKPPIDTMKLIRYSDPLSTHLRTFDNLYRPSLSRAFGSFDRFFDLAQGLAAGNRPTDQSGVAADLYEDDDNYYARTEMPGVKKQQVEVSLDEQLLTIGCQGRSEDDADECLSGHRSLTVPEGVDAEKVSAKLEDGVLTVTLPKAEQVKPRQIKVK